PPYHLGLQRKRRGPCHSNGTVFSGCNLQGRQTSVSCLRRDPNPITWPATRISLWVWLTSACAIGSCRPVSEVLACCNQRSTRRHTRRWASAAGMNEIRTPARLISSERCWIPLRRLSTDASHSQRTGGILLAC